MFVGLSVFCVFCMCVGVGVCVWLCLGLQSCRMCVCFSGADTFITTTNEISFLSLTSFSSLIVLTFICPSPRLQCSQIILLFIFFQCHSSLKYNNLKKTVKGVFVVKSKLTAHSVVVTISSEPDSMSFYTVYNILFNYFLFANHFVSF